MSQHSGTSSRNLLSSASAGVSLSVPGDSVQTSSYSRRSFRKKPSIPFIAIGVLVALGSVGVALSAGHVDNAMKIENTLSQTPTSQSYATKGLEQTATSFAGTDKIIRANALSYTATAIAQSDAYAAATALALTEATNQVSTITTGIANEIHTADALHATATASAEDTTLALENATSARATEQYKASARWKIRIYNIDDHAMAALNGVVIMETAYLDGDTGWVDITNRLIPGSNTLYFGDYNFANGYSWGFEIQYRDSIVWKGEAGEQGIRGANDDDRSRSMQTVFGQTLILYEDGIVAESTDDIISDSSYGPLSVGDLVVPNAPGIAIHEDPSENSPNAGIAKQAGPALRIVGGPVIVPTTSDDNQPMLRKWWQVTGWDEWGTAGWVTSRYIRRTQALQRFSP